MLFAQFLFYAIDGLLKFMYYEAFLCYLVLTYHLRNNVNMTESETSYTPCPEKKCHFIFAITLPNPNRSSKFY